MNPTERGQKVAAMRPSLASTRRRAQPLPESAPKPAHEDPAAPGRVAAILASPSYRPADRDPDFLEWDSVRGMRLANRVVVSPMCQYSAVEGTPDDWHLVHYGARALGGAGLLYTEMICVAPEARITPGCAGLYAPEHAQWWTRIVDFAREHRLAFAE